MHCPIPAPVPFLPTPQSPLTTWGPGCAAGLVAESLVVKGTSSVPCALTQTNTHIHTGQWGKDTERSFCPLTPALQPGRGSGPQVFLHWMSLHKLYLHRTCLQVFPGQASRECGWSGSLSCPVHLCTVIRLGRTVFPLAFPTVLISTHLHLIFRQTR